jgi:hypothetical protein
VPVAAGEAFWTDYHARLELQVAGLEARVDGGSELDIVALDWGVTRLALPQGSIDLRIWRVPRGGVGILTAEGEVRIDAPGVYRIDAAPAGPGGDFGPLTVMAFQGVALIPSDFGTVAVGAGQALTYFPGYDVDNRPARSNDLDNWARWRERQEAEWRREEDLWADYTGAGELDQAGDWFNDPALGRVWFPRVGPDWAPYRFGRWSYVAPWGWTWLDDAPWGFTPFHYGRWARFGDRWGWVPGRREAEPVYAPALVAFVGGRGWGLSVGIGGGLAIGWVPLAPNEAYTPPYRVSGDYVRRVNTPHVEPTVINNIVVNNTVVINRTTIVYRNAPAATVVSADTLSRGAPVQRAAIAPPAGALSKAAPIFEPLERLAPPTREAKAGLPTGAGDRGANPLMSAATPVLANAPHPPPKLQVVRDAVIVQPVGASRPATPLKPGAPPSFSPGGTTLQPHPSAGLPNLQRNEPPGRAPFAHPIEPSSQNAAPPRPPRVALPLQPPSPGQDAPPTRVPEIKGPDYRAIAPIQLSKPPAAIGAPDAQQRQPQQDHRSVAPPPRRDVRPHPAPPPAHAQPEPVPPDQVRSEKKPNDQREPEDILKQPRR